MSKPRALDLFCSAGGATRGLQQAGFHVTGVDIKRQPRYVGDLFVQADALKPPFDLNQFDLIWASPPCQAYSVSSVFERQKGVEYPDLMEPTRALLASAPCLTVIENVVGAPMRRDVILDGTMFGLKVIRRRVFEASWYFLQPSSRIQPNLVALYGYSCVVGGGRCSGAPKAANAWHTERAKRAAMGIDWMTRKELSQAIPPAFSEFIGRAALAYLAPRSVA